MINFKIVRLTPFVDKIVWFSMGFLSCILKVDYSSCGSYQALVSNEALRINENRLGVAPFNQYFRNIISKRINLSTTLIVQQWELHPQFMWFPDLVSPFWKVSVSQFPEFNFSLLLLELGTVHILCHHFYEGGIPLTKYDNWWKFFWGVKHKKI